MSYCYNHLDCCHYFADCNLPGCFDNFHFDSGSGSDSSFDGCSGSDSGFDGCSVSDSGFDGCLGSDSGFDGSGSGSDSGFVGSGSGSDFGFDCSGCGSVFGSGFLVFPVGFHFAGFYSYYSSPSDNCHSFVAFF